ncbi:arginine kinase-like [Dendronephthya gigantea]|uniref:arginine kinase-like n=1 Tax=Dendronephthya gigantea TaxID=151771 RepID=UPI00106C806D|nr:arginine kinase-like [Dendronephthya gigantea]
MAANKDSKIVQDTSMKLGDDINLAEQDNVELDPDLAQNKYPDLSGAKSIMAKYLTKDVFERLKDKKSSTGFTIARAVNTGVRNKPKSLMGCHAGDTDSYAVFGEFFDPVIEEYHRGFKPTDKHVTDMNVEHLKGNIKEPGKIISTRIRVARNITGFNLAPGQNTKDEKLAVEALMLKVFDKLEGDLKGRYYSLAKITEEERQQLVREHLLFKGNDKMQADSGYHRWWPHGRGIYLNENRTFAVWLNEGDHIRVISMQQGGDARSVFTTLVKAVNTIEALVKEIDGRSFQKTDHLGMITCCPTNLGTGLRGGVLIQLTKLQAKMGEDGLKEWANANHLQVRGLYGEHSDSSGAIYDVSNKYRLGYSEVQLVQFVIDGVNKLIEMEASG